jgi:VanZ family protein
LPAAAFKKFSFDTWLSIDKVVHILMYAGFYLLWSLTPVRATLQYRSVLLLAICLVYGVFIEILQGQMSLGRSYDVGDILANACGGVTGLLLAPLVIKKMPLIKKYLPFLNKTY